MPCDDVDQRANERLTLIGVHERIIVRTRGPHFPTVEHQCFAVVSLYSGSAAGAYHVRLELAGPTGDAVPLWRDEVTLRGSGSGQTIVQRRTPVISAPGLYHFDVRVGKRLVSRFPLRVEHKQQEAT